MSKLRENKFVSVAVATVVATLGVAVLTFAASTISTDISTGGTLTVTGASTLTGAVSAASTLGVTATSTFTGDARFNNGVGFGADNSVAKTVLFSGLTSTPNASEGRLFYNSTSKILQLYDGTQWANIASSTGGGGINNSGNRLQLTSLNSYLTLGTTTQQGLSMMTLEATSTAAIPLSVVGFTGQTANLLQLMSPGGSGGTNLLYVTSSGGLLAGASSTVVGPLTVSGPLNASSTLLVAGAQTFTGLSTHSSDVRVSGVISASSTVMIAGNLQLNGTATTTATTGKIATIGSVIASTTSSTLSGFGVATSTPAAEFAANGSATTTLYLTTTKANTGSCLQVYGTDGIPYRMYITAGDPATTSPTGRSAFIALWEAGSCK